MDSINKVAAQAAAVIESSEEEESSDARTELETALADIDSASIGSVEIPMSSYTEMTYDSPTDEEIAATAEALLASYKDESESAIISESEATEAALYEQIAQTQESSDSSSADISAIYAEATEDYSNDALKRGLARSSVATNNVAALESSEAASLTELINTTSTAINELESEISMLSVTRQSALDSFNISYAVALTEKINELTEERYEKEMEVLEYNNSLAEQTFQDSIDKATTESDLYGDAIDNEAALNELDSSNVEQAMVTKYELIGAYLENMSADEAKDMVLNDELVRDNLSDYYYYSLYAKYCT